MFRNLIAEISRHGIKTKQIADLLSVSAKTVNNKLNGRSEFTLSEINKIASIFPDVTIDYLFEITQKGA